MRQVTHLWLVVVFAVGLLAACRAHPPASAEATAGKPAIVDIRLALDIDPKTMQLKGSGAIFPLRTLNARKQLKVAILLRGLRGGETLSLTIVDPTGKESEPVVKQYGRDEQGEFYTTAFFAAEHWQPGDHQLKVNLNDEGFAIAPFYVVP